MAGRGSQTFKKRQKEQQRKEKQQEKLAKRLERKLHGPAPETDDDPFGLLDADASPDEEATPTERVDVAN